MYCGYDFAVYKHAYDFAVYKHATYNNKNHGQKAIYMCIGMSKCKWLL